MTSVDSWLLDLKERLAREVDADVFFNKKVAMRVSSSEAQAAEKRQQMLEEEVERRMMAHFLDELEDNNLGA